MLTEREAEVAYWVGQGLSNPQIGRKLFITEDTVKTHVRRIFKKLGFQRRAQVVAWQYQRAAGYPRAMHSHGEESGAPTVAHYGGPMRQQMGYTCAVHKHDDWVPFQDHHVWPLGLGGPNIASNKIRVCANGHYAIHAFLELLIKQNGRVPVDTLRHFGPAVRGYALSGWNQAGRPTTGTGGE